MGRRFGIEISRFRPGGELRNELLAEFGIGTVLDVGANLGQYAMELRRSGYTGRIVSFEPLAVAYDRLRAKADLDPDWETYPVALGDTESTETLGVASNLASSSLLPMLDTVPRMVPGLSMTGSETVEVRTLDSFELELDAPTLLKLDVQGYEDRVLRGAGSVLPDVTMIECEVSLEPLYDSQLTLLPMLNLLDDAGFEVRALQEVLRARAGRGHVVQYDAIAVRS